jgi:hypothetical protein
MGTQKTTKEFAEEYRKRIRPMYETFRESDGKPVSVYNQDDMVKMFEYGVEHIIEIIEKAISVTKSE